MNLKFLLLVVKIIKVKNKYLSFNVQSGFLCVHLAKRFLMYDCVSLIL